MRWEVLAQLIGDDGEVIWGVHRDEIVPAGGDYAQALIDTGDDMMTAVAYVADRLGRQVAGTKENIERFREEEGGNGGR